jgi:SAM-dependent methyltransferase
MESLIRRWFRRGAPDVITMVRDRFTRIATTPGRDERRIGSAVAETLGYDPAFLKGLPVSVTDSFAGVGNPLALGPVHAGETVLDLGSGAGLDSMLAARAVGPAGRVIGVDLTPEMVAKARRNAQALGLANVEFLRASVEGMPLAAGTADVAFCNGLFNLCPDKPKTLAEVYRVLKPGGRFLIADILLDEHVTAQEVARKGAWSD